MCFVLWVEDGTSPHRKERHALVMTDSFLEHRPLLFGIAYRMLGSVSEAEEVACGQHRSRSMERSALRGSYSESRRTSRIARFERNVWLQACGLRERLRSRLLIKQFLRLFKRRHHHDSKNEKSKCSARDAPHVRKPSNYRH